MMAIAVGAILGAVHLDGGDDALRHVLAQLRIVSPTDPLVMFHDPSLFLACTMQICNDLHG